MQETHETRVPSLDLEDPLEEEMATRSCVLAWRIPWTEEPGRLQSIRSQRVGHEGSNLTHPHTLHLIDKKTEAQRPTAGVPQSLSNGACVLLGPCFSKASYLT